MYLHTAILDPPTFFGTNHTLVFNTVFEAEVMGTTEALTSLDSDQAPERTEQPTYCGLAPLSWCT